MRDIGHLTGAFEVVEAQGKAWRLRPLTLNMEAELIRRLRPIILNEARHTISLLGPEEDERKEEIWRRAETACESPLISNYSAHPKAIQEWLWISLRAEHPDVQEAEVTALLNDLGSVQASAILRRLNNPWAARKNPTQPATAPETKPNATK